MNYQHCRIILLISLISLLSACSQSHSYPYYMTHPDKLSQAYRSCVQQVKQSKTTMIAQCRTVFKAAVQMRKLLVSAMSNQQRFGAEILALQMTLAKLRQQLNSATSLTAKQSLRQAIAEQLLSIDSRLAVVRLINTEIR